MRVLGLLVGDAEGVEDEERVVAAPLGQLLHRGLEAVAHHDDEIGGIDGIDLVGGELEIVRLGARRSEVAHLDLVAARGPSRLGEREERRDDALAPVRGRVSSYSRTRRVPVTIPASSDRTENDSHEAANLGRRPAAGKAGQSSGAYQVSKLSPLSSS